MRARDIMEKLKSDEEKEWFAEAMTAVILADKLVAKNELRPTEEIFKFLKKSKRDELIADLKKKEMSSELRESPKFDDREFAFKILSYFVGVTASDGDISPPEEGSLDTIRQKLGFQESTLKGLIDEWKKIMLSRKLFEDNVNALLKDAVEQKEPNGKDS